MQNSIFKLTIEERTKRLFTAPCVSSPGVRAEGQTQVKKCAPTTLPPSPLSPSPPSPPSISKAQQKLSVTQLKTCIKCSITLPLVDFPKNADSSDGYGSYCRTCKNKLSSERNYKDAIARFKHLIVTRVRYLFPKEEIPNDIETNLESYIGYPLSRLRQQVREDLHKQQLSMYNCFKAGWHLDHIRPIARFPKHKIGDDIFRQCWSYTNLKMIPSEENLKKGAKYDASTK